MFRPLFALAGMILAPAFLSAQPAIKPAAAPPPAGTAAVVPGPELPAQPVVRLFTVTPGRLGRREDLVFRWQVGPSPSGSPVAEVKVVAGAITLHTAATETGSYTFRAREWMYRTILPPKMGGRKTFALVARTAAGASARREVELEVLSAEPAIENLSVRPADIALLGETIHVGWRVSPGPSATPITGVLLEEMAEGGTGRHSLYTGRDSSGSSPVPTTASSLPGLLIYKLTVTNEAGLRAEREIRLRLARPEDVREKPDLTVEARETGWFMVGLTPRFKLFITLHNRGTLHAGLFEYQVVGMRGGSRVLDKTSWWDPGIEAGGSSQTGTSFTAEELHGATEITVIADPRNRLAELNEGNNRLTVPVPPAPR